MHTSKQALKMSEASFRLQERKKKITAGNILKMWSVYYSETFSYDYCAPNRSIRGTDPGIDSNANKEAMAIIAARPFVNSEVL